MKLTIVSGLSGSGKTHALNTLEDNGYYCVDNLPTNLLPELMCQLRNSYQNTYDNVAVGLDARSGSMGIQAFPDILDQLKRDSLNVEVIFLLTQVSILIRRFDETRRKHPLTNKTQTLEQAIELEKGLLSELLKKADIVIDTTQLNLHHLRQQITDLVIRRQHNTMALQIQSFGYKHGLPGDTDFIFDMRCLPNPYWEPLLRAQTGRDPAVINFLEQHDSVLAMRESLLAFLDQWIPFFCAENRAYLTLSIGCTGGQHRSVYMAEYLRSHFAQHMSNVLLRHRELT